MKKIILLFILLLPSLYADAKLYFGTNYTYFYETLQTQKQTAYSSTHNIGIKAGYGRRDAYAFEFSVDATQNDANIISENDAEKLSLNIELLKAFDLDLFFNPYIKAGFGAGYLKVDRKTSSTINFGSFNFGSGIFISLSDWIDLELGYLYKNISYEKANLIDQKIELNSDQHGAYAGIIFRF